MAILRIIALAGLLLNAMSGQYASAQNEYDYKLKISASHVLPPSVMNGRHYSIDPVVHSDGYMNRYVLRSEFGDMEVKGTYFLIKRITEIDALVFIKENYGTVAVLQDSVGETAEGLVTGPVKAAQKLYDTVSDTDKLSETVESIPGGIVNLFNMAADTIGDVADFAYKTGKSAVTSSKDNDNEKSGFDYDSGLKRAEKEVLDFIGYNKSYRELAKNLKIDPYTENEILLSEMRRVASLKAAANIGSKFVPSLYSIPGVGTANKYLGYADKVATYEDPREVDKLSRKILDSLGYSSEEKKNSAIAELMGNENFSPPMRHEITQALQKLQKVGQADSLILATGHADSRETAQFYVHSIKKFAEMSAKGSRFKSFLADVILPAGITDKNILIVPLPVDYLFWTPEVSKGLIAFRKKAISQKQVKSIRLLVGGKVTPLAKKQLSKIGISEILESVPY